MLRDLIGFDEYELRSDVSLTHWEISAGDDKRLRIADNFFPLYARFSMTDEILPTLPLDKMPYDGLPPDATLPAFPGIPVLFGKTDNSGKWIDILDDRNVNLDIDVFGSGFYMLTRIEEAVVSQRDQHGRFRRTNSILKDCGIYDRPLIDEYARMLWECMKVLWPGLSRKEPRYRCCVSHDVDIALQSGTGPAGSLMKWFVSESIRSRRPDQTLYQAMAWNAKRSRNFVDDPFNTYSRLLSLADRCGYEPAFYFLSGRHDPQYDTEWTIDNPFVSELIRYVQSAGATVGIHPSYSSAEDDQIFRSEVAHFRDLVGDVVEGRQHYLRWSVGRTWQWWADAGLSTDCSVGFADTVGFRCGTCFDFQVFDVFRRQRLGVRERPLIAMDVSLFSKSYMSCTLPEAFDISANLRDMCREVSGNFNVLIHNNALPSDAHWAFWSDILSG